MKKKKVEACFWCNRAVKPGTRNHHPPEQKTRDHFISVPLARHFNMGDERRIYFCISCRNCNLERSYISNLFGEMRFNDRSAIIMRNCQNMTPLLSRYREVILSKQAEIVPDWIVPRCIYEIDYLLEISSCKLT